MKRYLLALIVALGLTASLPLPPTHAQNVSGGTLSGTTLTLTDDANITKTLTGATPATERLAYSKMTLSPTGNTFAVASGGSIAGVRGEVNLPTGKTFTDGFLYGVDGRAIVTGVVNEASAARITGALGKVDTTGATLTAGQISGVWADLIGNAANAQTYPLRVSNSASVSPPALALLIGHATAAFEVSDLGNGSSGDFVVNTSGTASGQCAETGGLVATKALKIVADGTNYWIPLCTAP